MFSQYNYKVLKQLNKHNQQLEMIFMRSGCRACRTLPLDVGEQVRRGAQQLLDRVEREEARQRQEAVPHRRLLLQLVQHQHGGATQRGHLLWLG